LSIPFLFQEDNYSITVFNANTDETYEMQLTDIVARYKSCTNEGESIIVDDVIVDTGFFHNISKTPKSYHTILRHHVLI